MNIREFGQNFVGPILSQYLLSVIKSAKSNDVFFCLAREGHFISQAVNELKTQKLIEEQLSFTYLTVSRVFLFKLLLGNPESWQYSLAPKYEGDLQGLLVNRFNLSKKVIDDILSQSEQKTKIALPNDIDVVKGIFIKHVEQLSELVAESKAAYMSYLNSIDFGKLENINVVLDIGYSGTIQKLLTLISGVDTKGIYFIASKPGSHKVGINTVQMEGVFKEGVKLGDGHIMLDRSILLESLLTAPKPQLVGIRKSKQPNVKESSYQFFYGMRASTQKQFHLLDEIMSGAINHVIHCFKHNIEYTTQELDDLYSRYVTQPNMIPHGIRHLFEIDDAISGNSKVSYQQLFQL